MKYIFILFQKKAEPANYVRDISGYIEAIDKMMVNSAAQSLRQEDLEEILENEATFVNPKDLGLFE